MLQLKRNQKTVNEFRKKPTLKEIDEGYIKFLKAMAIIWLLKTHDNRQPKFYGWGTNLDTCIGVPMWNFVGRQNDNQGRYGNQMATG
jgi:hypothetical protein